MADDPFDSFSEIAFRVEALPIYVGDDGSSDELETFRSTGSVPPDHNDAWRAMVAKAANRGARVARLRVVSKPLSEYERFEVLAGYAAGVSAGEEVRVIADEAIDVPFDFWLYDNSQLEVMNYDSTGRFLGSEVRPVTQSERETVDSLLAVFERATPLADFVHDESL